MDRVMLINNKMIEVQPQVSLPAQEEHALKKDCSSKKNIQYVAWYF